MFIVLIFLFYYLCCFVYFYFFFLFAFFFFFCFFFFFFSSRRRHTRYIGDWSSDVCSSDLMPGCCPADRPQCCPLGCCPQFTGCCMDAARNLQCCENGTLCDPATGIGCLQFAFMNQGGRKFTGANGDRKSVV